MTVRLIAIQETTGDVVLINPAHIVRVFTMHKGEEEQCTGITLTGLSGVVATPFTLLEVQYLIAKEYGYD